MGMERPPTGHDIELAARAAGGDRQAYGELVRRHGSAVRGLLRRLGADSAAADDLAQDAFLTGFEQCAEFRGEGTFGGWIKKIAARLYLKKVKREARLIFSDAVEPVETSSTPASTSARPSSTTPALSLTDSSARRKGTTSRSR